MSRNPGRKMLNAFVVGLLVVAWAAALRLVRLRNNWGWLVYWPAIAVAAARALSSSAPALRSAS